MRKWICDICRKEIKGEIINISVTWDWDKKGNLLEHPSYDYHPECVPKRFKSG